LETAPKSLKQNKTANLPSLVVSRYEKYNNKAMQDADLTTQNLHLDTGKTEINFAIIPEHMSSKVHALQLETVPFWVLHQDAEKFDTAVKLFHKSNMSFEKCAQAAERI